VISLLGFVIKADCYSSSRLDTRYGFHKRHAATSGNLLRTVSSFLVFKRPYSQSASISELLSELAFIVARVVEFSRNRRLFYLRLRNMRLTCAGGVNGAFRITAVSVLRLMAD